MPATLAILEKYSFLQILHQFYRKTTVPHILQYYNVMFFVTGYKCIKTSNRLYTVFVLRSIFLLLCYASKIG